MAGMEYRQIAHENGLTTYALIFAEGDEAAKELLRFATETGDIALTEDGKPQVRAHVVDPLNRVLKYVLVL
jgi:hypothetical protein